MNIAKTLQQEFDLSQKSVDNTLELIDAGNTIPFIARYRKELTGGLDDQLLRELSERLEYLRNMEQRKDEVIKTVAEQGKATEEWMAEVRAAQTLTEVDDLYRPFRQKRRTRGSVARERGLEPLAKVFMDQKLTEGSIKELCIPYIDEEKELPDVEAVLAGVNDIIAEDLSDSAVLRKGLRGILRNHGQIITEAATEEDSVYSQYYEFKEAVKTIPSHRILAINRGEKEEFLRVRVYIDENAMIGVVSKFAVRGESLTKEYVQAAAEDGYKRLIFPSLEREIRNELTDEANEQAIYMFGENLRPTLMQPPLSGQVVLGCDPAFRTGCKLAVVDATGKVLDTGVMYPAPPHNATEEAAEILNKMLDTHGVQVIAIGNGTASQETEIFVANVLKDRQNGISYTIVNEAGASVYSASKLAAEEFPDYDVSLRSAASIARRLQDPMAELVKIDPKAIGVGQYQHDMPQKQLDDTLAGVVEGCVNNVGVDINTASPSLLSYVAGLTATTSKNIFAWREENGRFTGRTQIKDVPRLGPKAFEQCAGFLRIPGAENILDSTAVHPESYTAAQQLLELFSYTEQDVAEGNIADLDKKVAEYGEQQAAEACQIGVPTLRDIVQELLKPGRDIRDSLPKPVLRTEVMSLEDLKPGMELTGTVRNVIDFGAFVDVGVHQDGLVHISKMSNRYIKHPSEAAEVGDVVTVWVLSTDKEKDRISLSMVPPQEKK